MTMQQVGIEVLEQSSGQLEQGENKDKASLDSLEQKISKLDPGLSIQETYIKFPKETIEWAQNIANKLRKKHGKNKRRLATVLFEHDEYKDEWNSWSYGFDEALKTGNYAPFPHEIKKSAQCFSFMVAQYALAKELQLNPTIKNIFGMATSNKYKASFDDKSKYDHFFIDVNVGNKNPVIVDPLMGIYGSAVYNNHSIRIRDNGVTSYTFVNFDFMMELTEQDLLQKIQFLRTPQGSIEMLEVGEKLKDKTKIKYDAEKNQIERIFYYADMFDNKFPFPSHWVLRNRIQLDDNADIQTSKIEFGYYKVMDWCDFRENVLFDTWDVQDVISYANLIKKQEKEWKKTDFGKKEIKKQENQVLLISDMLKLLYKHNPVLLSKEESLEKAAEKILGNFDQETKLKMEWLSDRMKFLLEKHVSFSEQRTKEISFECEYLDDFHKAFDNSRKCLKEFIKSSDKEESNDKKSVDNKEANETLNKFMKKIPGMLDKMNLSAIIHIKEWYRCTLEEKIRTGKDNNGYIFTEDKHHNVFYEPFHKTNAYLKKKYIPINHEHGYLVAKGFIKDPKIKSKKRNIMRRMDQLQDLTSSLGYTHGKSHSSYHDQVDFYLFCENALKSVKDTLKKEDKNTLKSGIKAFPMGYLSHVSKLELPKNFVGAFSYAIAMDMFIRRFAFEGKQLSDVLKKPIIDMQKKIRLYLNEKQENNACGENS